MLVSLEGSIFLQSLKQLTESDFSVQQSQGHTLRFALFLVRRLAQLAQRVGLNFVIIDSIKSSGYFIIYDLISSAICHSFS